MDIINESSKETQTELESKPFEIKCPMTVETSCGFVRLVDVMPRHYNDPVIKCDESMVRSARVSYGCGSKGTDADSKLIKFLINHNHGTPLEAIVFTFHIRCPIFVQRHIVKHRIATMNEVSARYTKVKEEWYIPENFRHQSKSNRQASGEDFPKEVSARIGQEFDRMCSEIHDYYNSLLAAGVAREIARTILPQCMYTELYFTINLRSLLNFVNLRNSSDAQWETQEIARAMESIVMQTNPITMKTFRENNPIK
jgi:thymidylate synthase (FAD)